SENKHISAAGFILLSIGMGTFFSLQTSLGDETIPIYASGVLVLIPGFIFICYYNGFPKWVQIAGLVAAIPRFVLLILVYARRPVERNGLLDGLGYGTMNILGL